ncbi:RNA polymerase subunit sigma, partial [Paraburkholderia sp. UCT31]|nr:RNA polymerase subunit sigma [Paraburkholderia sp. UCT31]
GDRRGSTEAPLEQGAQSGRVVQSAAVAPSVSSTPCAPSDRSPRSSGDGRAASSAVVPATATVTQLRAFADGRPLNIPGAVADPAQETPDGL